MENRMKLISMLIIVALVFKYSCDNKAEDPKEAGKIMVKLTNDSAGDTALNRDTVLNIDINLVKVQYVADNTTEETWSEIATEDSTYNLSELQNGLTALIAQAELDVGKIKQLKLLLGENSTIVTPTDTFGVEIPLEYSGGVKIALNDSIVANDDLEIVLGIDTKSSVIDKNNGLFSLMPVIKVIGVN